MNRRKTKVDILKIEGCHKVTSYHFLKKTKKKNRCRDASVVSNSAPAFAF